MTKNARSSAWSPIGLSLPLINWSGATSDYAGGIGLFDRLQEAIVLDFNDSLQMRQIFETLIEEYQRSGPACAAMMTALMNQCLIEVLRRAEEQAGGSLP